MSELRGSSSTSDFHSLAFHKLINGADCPSQGAYWLVYIGYTLILQNHLWLINIQSLFKKKKNLTLLILRDFQSFSIWETANTCFLLHFSNGKEGNLSLNGYILAGSYWNRIWRRIWTLRRNKNFGNCR